MSGGVDSSVAAFLLLQKGYEVIGATIETGFGSVSEQAALICRQLGIAHHLINARDIFEQKIIRPFVYAYLEGLTPNPCVMCNAEIKFPLFLPLLHELDADYLATGHYARIFEKEGRLFLRRAKSLEKDQSYFMYRIPGDILKFCLLPLGEYSKKQVRAYAAENQLAAASQKDSYDICFIPNGDYRSCLNRYAAIMPPPGDIVDQRGNILGRHEGLPNYTLGQRRGLNITLGYPVYVVALDYERNRLIVGKKDDLLFRRARVGQLTCLSNGERNEPFTALVQIRYKMKPVEAEIIPDKDQPGCADIVFNQPVWAVTPGQSAVFYDNDFVLGGGLLL